MARVHLTWISADQGRFAEGVVYGQDGIRLAEALDHPYSLAHACRILGYLQTTRGALIPAVGLFERGVALSREWNLTIFSVLHTGSLGHAYAVASGSWGFPRRQRPSMADYVAMTEARRRGDRRRMAFMLFTVPPSVRIGAITGVVLLLAIGDCSAPIAAHADPRAPPLS